MATITGTFNSLVSGTISGVFQNTAGGVLSGVIGTPGPRGLTGATGPAGATGATGSPGQGVPTGGTAGQVLKKLSSTNYDTAWQTDLNSGVWGSITGDITAQTDLQTSLGLKANLASPALTGVPTAPTAATLTSTTQLATTAFVQQELAAGTAIARNLEVEVRNQSGASIPAGSIVYISGATGNKPLITLSQANNDANSAQTMGFVKTTIANNGTGYVIVRGVLENIDTSALTEGAQLYLSPTTAGTWTTTKPYAPSHLVYVGVVIRSHPNQGTILVAVQNGYELDELHNVAAQTPSDLDLLSYESSTSLWKNKSFSTLGLLTSANAATTYYPLSGNPSGFLTSASLSGYALLSGATFTGEVATPASTTTTAGFSIAPGTAPTSPTNGEIWNTGSDLQVRIAGVTETLAEQSWVTTQLGSYLTTASAASTYQTQAGMSSYLTTANAASTYAALAGATFTGLVSTPASTTTTAGLRIAHGSAPTTPVNGDVWTTTGGFFWRQNGTTYQAVNLSGTQTVSGAITFSNATLTLGNSTAASTYNLGTGATLAATTKAINIGTNGVASSTTNIAIGSTTGTNAITINGPTTLAGTVTATGTTLDLGNSTGTATYSFGSGTTTTGLSKAVNIGTNGGTGSTTNITIGTSVGTSTTTLQGTTNGVTAAADNNTTALATTAYVVGQAGSATPLVDGTAAVGTSLRYARQDHVHPTDTSRAALASPTFTGTPAAPTAAADTNTTQLATTAFVVGQASSTAPVMDGTANVGTSLKYARADHVHPTDTSRAPLASPTFTGVPAAPTAAVDTNTTQLATTAYVVGQGYAKLASPALSGTPTAPTATVGTNTTQIATTAFVTSAVPSFGATADINEPSSTTKAASIANVRDMLLSPGYQFLYLAVGVSGTNLSGYYSSNGGRFKDYASSTTAGSYGQWTLDTNASSIGYAGYTRGDNLNVHNWSKKIWMTGRCLYGVWSTSAGIGDANTFARVNLGGKNGFGSGDISATLKGIGWKFAGGGTSPLVLTVSNGSTLTNVTSSFTPVAKQAFDWTIYSDGAGNVTLYVNDSQVATTALGPTGTQSYGLYIEGCDATATATTAISISTFGTKIYHGT